MKKGREGNLYEGVAICYSWQTDEVIILAISRGMSRGQGGWSDEPSTSGSASRRGGARQTAGLSTRTSASALEERASGTTPCKGGFRLGVYGWRKKCLYSFVLILMITVILNLALTVWIFKVMGFSSEGIGSLKVVPGGIELRGQAAVLDALVASSLRSRRGKNLVLESWSNFTASARSHDGRLLARLTVVSSSREERNEINLMHSELKVF
ncbi:hypothetical protein DMN91_011698 [Ooceraea biroi]|uniref:Zeta-sarcoglycan n=1 Tax=Ooceraea biroi TaxID=2015173 RepID=A0A3L8D6A3_OOCBI|nr:hypothetical protein DMN91_011698 [Ooceraea biroi]